MPDDHDSYLADNRAHWDEAAAIHPRTDAYDVAGFLDGESSLTPIERAELPDLDGVELLHLQCHFGLDTLSLARRGATVTGLDFSEEAIETARELAAESGLDDRASFLAADVFDAAGATDGEFDVVFTSYGVLDWLPDLDRWATAVADTLRSGGTFYVAEFHPFCSLLPWAFDGGETTLDGAYETPAEPLTFDEDGTYADEDAELEHTRTHFWPHGLGEIVTALARAGLRIEFLHEHQRTPWDQFDGMIERPDGLYEFPELELPLVFSLEATKPS